jgi:hypothetical protein
VVQIIAVEPSRDFQVLHRPFARRIPSTVTITASASPSTYPAATTDSITVTSSITITASGAVLTDDFTSTETTTSVITTTQTVTTTATSVYVCGSSGSYNAIQNPSFESGELDPWEINAPGGQANSSIQSAVVEDGNFAL